MAAPTFLQLVIVFLWSVVSLAVIVWIFDLLFRFIAQRYRYAMKLHHFIVSLILIEGLLISIFLIADLLGLVEILLGSLAAIGATGLVLGLGLVPWVSDFYSGLALMLNPHIKIGTEVEVAGKRGRIILITLTTTRIAGDGCIVIVPNRKFRDEVVVIYGTKPPERMVEF